MPDGQRAINSSRKKRGWLKRQKRAALASTQTSAPPLASFQFSVPFPSPSAADPAHAPLSVPSSSTLASSFSANETLMGPPPALPTHQPVSSVPRTSYPSTSTSSLPPVPPSYAALAPNNANGANSTGGSIHGSQPPAYSGSKQSRSKKRRASAGRYMGKWPFLSLTSVGVF